MWLNKEAEENQQPGTNMPESNGIVTRKRPRPDDIEICNILSSNLLVLSDRLSFAGIYFRVPASCMFINHSHISSINKHSPPLPIYISDVQRHDATMWTSTDATYAKPIEIAQLRPNGHGVSGPCQPVSRFIERLTICRTPYSIISKTFCASCFRSQIGHPVWSFQRQISLSNRSPASLLTVEAQTFEGTYRAWIRSTVIESWDSHKSWTYELPSESPWKN